MGFAAIAFAKQKLRKQIFAVSASAGPGSANLVPIAANAYANNIPILILPADTFATRQPDPVLQQLEHDQDPGLTTNDAFKAVSRYFDRIQRPEQIQSSLIKAFETMTNPATTGPATIALPQDVEAESYEFDEEFFKKRVYYVDRRVPTKREVDEAVKAISSSKYPVIIAGGGAKYAEATEELKALSDK